MSKKVQTDLERLIPHKNIQFNCSKGPIAHPRAHYCRYVATQDLRSQILGIRGVTEILDVGGSPMNYSNHVHCCEAGRDAYTTQKVLSWARVHGPPLTGNAHATNQAWSFCRCRAEECTHHTSQAAMMVHSVYYNTPQQIADICSAVNGPCFSLHHQFDRKGSFYSGEIKYHREGETIVCNAEGNAQAYIHPNIDWLDKPYTRVRVLRQGIVANPVQIPVPVYDDAWLLHSDVEPGFDGETVVVRFDVVFNDPGGFEEPEQVQFVDEDEILLDTDDLSVTASKELIIVGAGDHRLPLPKSIYAELVRYISAKPIGKKTFELTLGQARRLCRSHLHSDLDPLLLARVPTALAMAAISAVTDDEEPLYEQFFQSDLKEKLELRSKWLSFEKWGHPTWMYWLKAVQIVLAGLILCWNAYYVAEEGALGDPGTEELLKLVVLFTQAALQALFPYLVHNNLFEMFNRLYWRVNAALFVATTFLSTIRGTYRTCILSLILLIFFLPSARSAPHNGDMFYLVDEAIHLDRQMPDYEGHYPLDYTIKGFETLIDPKDYPTHPKAVIKNVLEDEPVRARPIITWVGPMFNNAVPVAFSRSNHNLTTAVYTRAIPKVHSFEPSDLLIRKTAWAELAETCDGLLKLSLDHGVVVCDVEVPGKEHPTYPSWKDYIQRFPPAKRARLNVAMEKLSQGEFKRGMFTYSGFVKREKQMIVTQNPYVPVRPRLIQGVSVYMKALKGPWFLNYSNCMKYAWHIHHEIWYSSGCTPDMQSHWFNYHAERIGDFIVVYSDFSKYDVTQGEECMEREREHYRDLGFCDEDHGSEYLEAQACSRVYNKDMMWQVPGTRKSGDNNTSSGNTKNTAESFLAWFIPLCILHRLFWREHMAMACLGDDNFVLVSRRFVDKVFGGRYDDLADSLAAHNAKLGYSVKVGVTDNVVEAEYLSLRFYPVNGSYRVGKKPGRVLSKIGAFMYRQGCQHETYLQYLKGTLVSYLPTANHVPFLRRYVSECLDKLVGVEARYTESANFRQQGRLFEADDSTWAAFMELYGEDLGPDAEDEFASSLKNHSLNYMHRSTAVARMFEIDFLM